MTVKTDLQCLQSIPNLDALSLNFNFVEDLILRKNIAIVLQYIIFLISLEKNHSLPGAISYTIYKDMIVQTACIAECLLCYGITKGIDNGKTTLSLVGISENKFKNFQKVYDISPSEKAGAVIQIRKSISPKDGQFNDLIPAAKRIGLVNETLKGELDLIRIARNKIHLSSLTKVDDVYVKEDVEKMFATVKKLKNSIVKYLN